MELTPEIQAAKDDFTKARRLTAITLRHNTDRPGAAFRYTYAANTERALRAALESMLPVDTRTHPHPETLPQIPAPKE